MDDTTDITYINKTREITPREGIDEAPDTTEHDHAEMTDMLLGLKTEHRRIDTEIKALIETGAIDMINIRRMKKIKLSIKDQITYFENILTPDIIA